MRITTTISSLAQIVTRDHDLLTGLADDDHTQYIRHALAMAVSDFLIASGAGVFVKKTLAEAKSLLGVPTVVTKTADETVNNSSVLQNDNHLLFPIAANEVDEFRIVLYITRGNPISDFKFALTIPSGVITYRYMGTTAAAAIAEQMTETSGGALTGEQAGVRPILVIEALAMNGAGAGNVQFQWAQNTANVSDTIVKAGSCLIAHKVA